MKKLLFATAFASTALASSMGCNTDTLTGLHFGLGVSVLFDKYEADVSVGTSAPYAKHIIQKAEETVNGDAIKEVWMCTPALVKAKEGGGYENTPSIFDGTAGYDDTDKVYNVYIDDVKKTLSLPYYASRALFIKNHTFNKRTTNCGGEIKLAYFHDFGNHLMIGVDLTGVIASKNKKTIQIMPEMPKYPETLSILKNSNLTINGTDPTIDPTNGTVTGLSNIEVNAKCSDNSTDVGASVISVGTTVEEMIAANEKGVFLDVKAYDEGGEGKADSSFNEMALVAAQFNIPQYNGDTIGSYLETKDPAQLTFEKSVFNPRLAFIVGGTVYGWFAGLRLGMSYTTGKVYATGGQLTGQGTNSKTVSISSPLIGLHLMKQLKIAGNNDAHLYLTADWNIGDGRRSVYMNGVRNFRQTGYNISAGITWRFKLGN